ncbi:alanyl-tRNA editing protein [Dinoroseobacter sp. PD6]|uniref:alanyl-tRNA editing protein n=1 Tax=Dinoroseobacter sp. PD6 TaxID=3028384 RepID=UPI00237B3A46|nr:alanyl-tRNA editing protein [Dinoroseobacter sp. PD6]MDD9716441.1 alanyl-tRNA editing protein [Dinoroseobacter sp. PD6]
MTRLLFRDDAYLQECTATVTALTPEGGIVTDQTVFYATGGGQPGDAGRIAWDGGEIEIATAVKLDTGAIAHVPAEAASLPHVGAGLRLSLDWARRHSHMRIHTALHLLSVVIPLPVTGGGISAQKGRLDFDMPDAPEDRDALEAQLATLIERDLPVADEWITEAELLAKPELVKTMAVKPPLGSGQVRLVRIGEGADTVDLQPCGGTHVARTGEIGRVVLGKIEKKGRQNRRVNLLLDP